ncbi:MULTISPECIES: porin [Ralstonia solanacearum species complex]|uniref:porin n=1 Tax=Ralstonia solanacearum species complex TaxID=3116862 RepID=UPI000E567E11|nr:porin [Ralstonia solanacearum]AXV76790.1 porin [Ralstonia solanacearum]AXV90802.1 porin [Ralstonia solanacearum]AXW18957.1 porin [Ralstonia solanacearum]AXW75713.1 porin [Ralstonia solanacearum]
MKKKLAVLFATGSAMTTPALAQSNVTLYGLLDSTIRYTTHENAAGSSKVQMGDGVLTGSRWGMRGTEDLGNNTKALFVLESGFAPDTGVSQQGNRLFGRKAYVGLQGDFGAITLGRQFTVIHEVIASYDAMALASLGIVGFQGGPYTGGVRQDNMVKYTGTFGGLTVAAQHALGEAAGSVARSSSTGASLSYAAGPLLVAGGYQVMRDTNTYYGVKVPNSNQNVWSLGGSYTTGPAMLYLGYTNSNVGAADYRNHAIYAGMKYAFAPAWSLIAMGTYDRLRHGATSGNRFTGALMLDYALSKRTDVYVEADYTTLSSAWRTLGGQADFATPMFGYGNRFGATVGLRHQF